GSSCLPAGAPTAPQTRRPASGDIVQKLVEPGRSFDLVVIDTGSVARHPYVQPLAEVVDDIVLVARAGRSRKEDIVAAVAGLNINAPQNCGSGLTGGPGPPAGGEPEHEPEKRGPGFGEDQCPTKNQSADTNRKKTYTLEP